MARINFVLPFFPTKPVGGVKNVYQFANRLAARGHEVSIVHSIKRPFKQQRTPVWLRLVITKWRARRGISWFNLSPSIEILIVPEASDNYVPDADATICTWWQMAYAINELSPSKGRKCNLVQDYELWTGQEDLVHQSYRLPLRHIVIAEYLQELVSKYNAVAPELINTPIDTEMFTITTPIEARDPHSLIMMYSEEPRKGSQYGIEALEIVREKIPDVRVTFFSVYARPSGLPGWIDFTTRPSNLPELYNRHAIFISPSLGEGWALPPPESMLCGCAVVCTNIGGHRDYAKDRQTALLAEAKDPAQMAEKIKELMLDVPRRQKLAGSGNEFIRMNFTWDKAVSRMEQLLLR